MRASAIALLSSDDDVATAIRRSVPADVGFEAIIGAGREEAFGQRTVRCDYIVLDARGQDPRETLARLAAAGGSGEVEVLIVGDAEDLGLYRELTSNGVAEYVAAASERVEELLAAAFRRLEAQRRAKGVSVDPAKIVTVCGIGGGAGASVIAAAIARASAASGTKTLLVEMCLSGGQNLAFDVESSRGAVDILRTPDRLDALMLGRLVAPAGNNLSLLSGDMAFHDPSVWTDAALSAVAIRGLSAGFQRVIFDAGCDDAGRRALLMAGTEVLVTNPTVGGLRDTVRVLTALREGGAERRTLIVASRTGEHGRSGLPAKEFGQRLERPIREVPYAPAVLARAALGGEAPDAKTPAARALDSLAREVLGLPPPKPRSLLDQIMGR